MVVSSKLDELIKNNDIYGKIFLFYGENKLFKNNCINKIKKNYCQLVKGINFIVLDDSNINNLISEINTPAFGFDKKLILINNSKIFIAKKKKDDNTENEKTNKSKSYEDDILEFLNKNEIPSNITIIFNENDINKTKKIYKLIDKKGIVF